MQTDINKLLRFWKLQNTKHEELYAEEFLREKMQM